MDPHDIDRHNRQESTVLRELPSDPISGEPSRESRRAVVAKAIDLAQRRWRHGGPGGPEPGGPGLEWVRTSVVMGRAANLTAASVLASKEWLQGAAARRGIQGTQQIADRVAQLRAERAAFVGPAVPLRVDTEQSLERPAEADR